MSASEEIRVITRAVEGREVDLGITDLTLFARIMQSKIPSSGYRGARALEQVVEDAFTTLARKQRGGEVRDPKNFVLAVFQKLVTGTDVASAPTSRASSPGGVGSDDGEWREIEAMQAKLFADRARNQRVEAVEAWRRNRDLPTPHWALGGFDSPEAYEQGKRGFARGMTAAKPETPKRKRGAESLEGLIERSKELRDLDEINDLEECGT